MAENKNHNDTIDLGNVIHKLLKKRKRIYMTWFITAVASYLLILCVPRYYSSEAKLAPEMGSEISGGALGDIASSFGFDISSMQSNDAISPILYPDLMDDNAFIANIFTIRVKSSDGQIDTDYYTYLKDYQKTPWWSKILFAIKKLFKAKEDEDNSSHAFDPYNISKRMSDIMESIRGDITISVDKKTGVISVQVKAQDQLICKTVADSMIVRLQDFITQYRTNKARIDEKHYEQLAEEALKKYEKSRIAYSRFADMHTNSVLNAYRTEEEALQNDMQLKYTTYSTICAQLQQSRAKVQERTPAFTLLQGAAVPVKPAGPKRIMFVIGMLFLVTFIFVFYQMKDDIKASLLRTADDK